MSGLPTLVQYWKSLDHLQAYANDRQRLHQPTWLRYVKRLAQNGAAGIWHETYAVGGGAYESLYANMPPWGHGLFKPLTPVAEGRQSAKERLRRPLGRGRGE